LFVGAGLRPAPTSDAAITTLNGWWAKWHSDILRAYEEALNLGDCYLVVNADLSVTVVPPHVVDPLLDSTGEVVGWRITETIPIGRATHPSSSGVFAPLPEFGEGLGVG